jgi:hypothetical protein
MIGPAVGGDDGISWQFGRARSGPSIS